MNVVLVHPIHGAKVAINDVEMRQDEQNGWTRYIPVETTPETDNIIGVEPEAEKPVRKKPTRKVTEQLVDESNEVPSFLTSANDESEGD